MVRKELIESGHIKEAGGLYLRQIDFRNAILLLGEYFEDGRLKPDVVGRIYDVDVPGIELNDGFGYDLYSLKFAEQIPWIEEIAILRFGGVEGEDLKKFRALRKFINNYTGEPVDFLSFPKLEEADILWSKGRENILECSSLRSLTIHKLKSTDFRTFKKLTHLKRLTLLNPSLVTLDGIENLPNLEYLEIYGNRNFVSLTPLKSLSNLRKLYLEKCSKLEDVHVLKDCKNLTSIAIEDCKNLKDNDAVFTLYNLKLLALRNSGDIKTLDGVRQMKHLERFLIYNTNVIDGDMTPLTASDHLTVCRFTHKKHYNLTEEDIPIKADL